MPVEQAPHRLGRELGLGQESGGRAVVDEIHEVVPRERGDQDDERTRRLAVICEAPREFEAALPAQHYVEEHDVGPMRARLPKSLRTRGRDGRDRQAAALEQRTGGLEEDPVVVDDQAVDAHHKSVATDLPSYNPASRNPQRLSTSDMAARRPQGEEERVARPPTTEARFARTIRAFLPGGHAEKATQPPGSFLEG